jgi:ABC-type transport system substrate-binding protein
MTGQRMAETTVGRERRSPRTLLVIGVAVIVVGAIGFGIATRSPSPNRTLSIAYDSTIATLDPAESSDERSNAAVRLVFDTLLAYDAGTNLVPSLAAAMPTVSTDGRTFTFVLRPDIPFVRADGTELRQVRASDVVATINRILDPALLPKPSPARSSFFGDIEGAADVIAGKATAASGVRAVDALTVEFRLTHPSRTFLNVLALPYASIVPVDIAGRDTTWFSTHPVGTGPFVLREFAAGQHVTFQRNPHFWGASGSVDGIDIRLGIDATVALEEAKSGSLDITGNGIPPGAFDATVADPRLAGRVYDRTMPVLFYLFIDTKSANPALADARVRQAINLAIDRGNVVRIARRGDPAFCIYPPELPGFDATCRPYQYDPARARALLAEAGYAGGFRTSIVVSNEDPDRLIAQALQQDLADVGIQADLRPVEFGTLLKEAETPGETELGYVGWGMDYPDPSNFVDPLLRCSGVVVGGLNYASFCDPALDALAQRASETVDETARFAAYRDLQRRIMAEAPWAPLWFSKRYAVVSARVTNFAIHPVYRLDLRSYGLAR